MQLNAASRMNPVAGDILSVDIAGFAKS